MADLHGRSDLGANRRKLLARMLWGSGNVSFADVEDCHIHMPEHPCLTARAEEIQSAFARVMDRVPDRPVPDWDRVSEPPAATEAPAPIR